MKTRLMKCDAVSEIVGTVLLIGLAVSVFGVLYLFAVPDLETYASSIVRSPEPEITGWIQEESIILQHEGGNRISSYSLIVNSNLTQQGSNFVIGSRITNPLNITHPNSVMLVDDEHNEIVFDAEFPAFALFNPEEQNEEPEEPNPYLDVTNWGNNGGGSGGYTQIGDSIEFFDNLTSEYYWWETPLNHTGSVTVNITIKELNVTDAWTFIAVGICGDDRGERMGDVESKQSAVQSEWGYWYYAGGDWNNHPYTVYDAVGKNRTWSITLNESTHKVSYAVYEGSVCLWSALDKDYAYQYNGGLPKNIFIYTSGYRKCRVLISDIEVS